MKRYVYFFLVFSVMTCFDNLKAVDEVALGDDITQVEVVYDEKEQISALIRATEESLEQLKELSIAMHQLNEIEAICMKNPDDTRYLYQLAQAGHSVYESIQKLHLEDFFRPDFVAEMKKLHAIADKKTIPPIR